MMEKSALAGEGATYKVAVYAPVERADTLPVFHLYSKLYPLLLTIQCQKIFMNPLKRRYLVGSLLEGFNLSDMRKYGKKLTFIVQKCRA
jgi:hypothetical protein